MKALSKGILHAVSKVVRFTPLSPTVRKGSNMKRNPQSLWSCTSAFHRNSLWKKEVWLLAIHRLSDYTYLSGYT